MNTFVLVLQVAPGTGQCVGTRTSSKQLTGNPCPFLPYAQPQEQRPFQLGQGAVGRGSVAVCPGGQVALEAQGPLGHT